jgi:hypothetical protein
LPGAYVRTPQVPQNVNVRWGSSSPGGVQRNSHTGVVPAREGARAL